MNMGKKFISFIIVLILLLSSIKVMAVERKVFITTKINGTPIKMDMNPYQIEDDYVLPLRQFAETLGAQVEWTSEEKKITLTYNERIIQLYLDKDIIIIDEEEKKLVQKVVLTNGVTMAPINLIAESLDCTIGWDKQTFSILVNREGVVVEASNISTVKYNDDEVIWLSRIVEVEGKDLTLDGKVGIANVVLNRTKSQNFPNCIYNVIFDKEYCVQFPTAYRKGFRKTVASDDAIIAAKMALEGINNVEDCLYFNNSPFKSNSVELFKVINTEYFYKEK